MYKNTTMKKYLLLVAFALFAISCSKKEVIISGKINNAQPLSRMELIDFSSVSTLPIANIGIDEKGNFSDTLRVEKDGVYVLVYEGRVNFLYLEKGKDIQITGNGSNFPEDLKVTGEGQANNQFLVESQRFINSYLSKLDVTVLAKNETEFIKEMEKMSKEMNQKIDEIAKNTKADSKVVGWKKDDLLVNLLMISNQYEKMHGQMTQNPDFKVSQKYRETQKKLEKNTLLKEYPSYRQYLLSKLEADFRNFATPYLNNEKTTQTEVFAKFLETRKELSQDEKDYLLAFVASSYDIQPGNQKLDEVMKIVNENIKNEGVKKELERVYSAINGLKIGTQAPDAELITLDGKTKKISDLKGKPTLLIFYSSWARGMGMIAPSLKEITDFYQSKLNIAYINMDDNMKQFQKTAKSLFDGFVGTQFYAKNGLKSDIAQKYHIYGFKLPSALILDKEGKIASPSIQDFMLSADFIQILNRQTGLNAPVPELPNLDEMHHHENDGHNH